MLTLCVLMCLTSGNPDSLFSDRMLSILEQSRRNNDRAREYQRYMLDKRKHEKPKHDNRRSGDKRLNQEK